MLPRQAVILCGGLGTRLGQLTENTPKPLLEIGGVPFLEILVREVARSGIRRFLLLARYHSTQVESFAEQLQESLGAGYSVKVRVESEPAGTGGAVYDARDELDELFLLLNGDSFFDFPLHILGAAMDDERAQGAIALRSVPDSSRYGEVTLNGNSISGFVEKSGQRRPGLINGGVYLLRRTALDLLQPRSSLEQDLFPQLAERQSLRGREFDGFFIDIGLPETYCEADRLMTAHRRRPAAFLDRDGVINRDHGHVGTIGRWDWMPGAIDAIRRLNSSGYYVFVITNQAGIAKGKFTLEDYWRLRDEVREQLFSAGAQIDDERYCPYHPEATIPQWRGASDWRKPGPGMIRDLMSTWPVNSASSFVIGDQPTDLQAGVDAGIRGYLFEGGDLDQFVTAALNGPR